MQYVIYLCFYQLPVKGVRMFRVKIKIILKTLLPRRSWTVPWSACPRRKCPWSLPRPTPWQRRACSAPWCPHPDPAVRCLPVPGPTPRPPSRPGEEPGIWLPLLPLRGSTWLSLLWPRARIPGADHACETLSPAGAGKAPPQLPHFWHRLASSDPTWVSRQPHRWRRWPPSWRRRSSSWEASWNVCRVQLRAQLRMREDGMVGGCSPNPIPNLCW